MVGEIQRVKTEPRPQVETPAERLERAKKTVAPATPQQQFVDSVVKSMIGISAVSMKTHIAVRLQVTEVVAGMLNRFIEDTQKNHLAWQEYSTKLSLIVQQLHAQERAADQRHQHQSANAIKA